MNLRHDIEQKKTLRREHTLPLSLSAQLLQSGVVRHGVHCIAKTKKRLKKDTFLTKVLDLKRVLVFFEWRREGNGCDHPGGRVVSILSILQRFKGRQVILIMLLKILAL